MESESDFEHMDAIEKQHLDYRNIFLKKDEHGQVVKSKNLQPKQKKYPVLEDEDRVIQRNPETNDQEFNQYHEDMEEYMHETTVGVRLRETTADYKQAPGLWKRIIKTINFDILDFSPLGVGYPQFFVFIKYCIYILITFFFASGGYNMLAQGGKVCGKNSVFNGPCPTDLSYSLANRMFTHSSYQKTVVNDKVVFQAVKVYDYITYNYLHILTIVGVILVMIALRSALRALHKRYAENHIPITEYSIYIKHAKRLDKQFLDNFEPEREKKNIATFIRSEHNIQTIQSVTLFYRYHETKKEKVYTGKAYVLFNSEKDQETVLHNVKINEKRNKQNVYRIKAQTHEPLDINWENTGVTTLERKRKNMINYFYDFAVLLIAFLIICWFQHYTDTGKIWFNGWGSAIDRAISQDKEDRMHNTQNNLELNMNNTMFHNHKLGGRHYLKQNKFLEDNHDQEENQFQQYTQNVNEFITDGEEKTVLNYTFYRLKYCFNNHYYNTKQQDQTCKDNLLDQMHKVDKIYKDYPVVTLRWYLLMQRIYDTKDDVCSFKDHQNASPFQDCVHKTLQQQVTPQFPLPFANLNECDFFFSFTNKDTDLFATKYFIKNEVTKFINQDLSTFEKWDLLKVKMEEWVDSEKEIDFWFKSKKNAKFNIGIDKTVKLNSKFWQCMKQKVEDQIPLNNISYWCDTLFIFPLLIEVMNNIIGMVIEYTTEKTRNFTHTQDVAQMAKRNCVLEFINSAIGFSFIYCFYPLLSYTEGSLIYWKNMYEIEHNKIIPQTLEQFVNIQRVKYQIEQPGGLISITYSWIFMSNLIITPFIYSIGPPDRLINAVSRFCFRRKNKVIAKEGKEEYTAFTYVLHERYAYIINTMMVTAFFAPLLPISLVWSCISLMIMYCIEKYKLLNSASVTRPVKLETTLVMCNMLDYFLPIYCFGYMMFSYLATSNEFIHYAMSNESSLGEYRMHNWQFLWLQSDDKNSISNLGYLHNYGIITMLDSFIQWGFLGIVLIIGYFVIAYILDWKQKQGEQKLTQQLIHNELLYSDARKLLFETDYNTEQKKFEEEYFEEEEEGNQKVTSKPPSMNPSNQISPRSKKQF